MIQHSKPPWAVGTFNKSAIVSSSIAYHVATAYGTRLSDEECEANARRIVACVNALDGFSTEELEALLATNRTMKHVLATVIGLADEYATGVDGEIQERHEEGDDTEAVEGLIELGAEINRVMSRACKLIGIQYVPIRSTPDGE